MMLMLVKRWYVFSFLLCFLIASIRFWGVKQSLKFLVLGFIIAWASEAISIRWGFPYGIYRYHYDAMPSEWMLAGVPFWDSLSYVFLAFFSYCFALSLRAYYNAKQPFIDLQRSIKTILFSAIFMTILDVIIDPVANQGEKWFLGKIYDYPSGGFYFGVPISNFLGWLLVGFVMILLGVHVLPAREFELNEKALGAGVFFFMVVALFNLAITAWIKDYALFIVSSAWFIAMFYLWLSAKKSRSKIELHIDL